VKRVTDFVEGGPDPLPKELVAGTEPVRVIIAGSRDVTDPRELWKAINSAYFDVDEVVSGCARGADRLGELYAEANGLTVHRFPADWPKYGRSAGPIRNREMAEFADALIALWDGESRGTKNMIETMRSMGKPVVVHLVKKPEQ
jgi:YspA, cpYpsA-related SLOG family